MRILIYIKAKIQEEIRLQFNTYHNLYIEWENVKSSYIIYGGYESKSDSQSTLLETFTTFEDNTLPPTSNDMGGSVSTYMKIVHSTFLDKLKFISCYDPR